MSMSNPTGLIVVDHAHLKEFFEADDKILSNIEGILVDHDFRYTFRASIYNSLHVHVIRNQLTQQIASKMPDIIDELATVLGEDLDRIAGEGNVPFSNYGLFNVDWTSFVVYDKTLKIVSRI